MPLSTGTVHWKVGQNLFSCNHFIAYSLSPPNIPAQNLARCTIPKLWGINMQDESSIIKCGNASLNRHERQFRHHRSLTCTTLDLDDLLLFAEPGLRFFSPGKLTFRSFFLSCLSCSCCHQTVGRLSCMHWRCFLSFSSA